MPGNVAIPIPERVLLIRPSALGDVARTVPVLASLRKAWPRARIDWLVQKGFEGAVEAHPALTASGGRVIEFDRKRYGRWTSPGSLAALMVFAKSLRAERYDVVIDAQGLLRSGLLTRATRARVRVGFADAREGGWIGYTRRVRVQKPAHTVDRMLALLPAVGVEPVKDLRLYARPEELAEVDRSLGGSPFAVLAPTSRWPAKQWPPERYIDVAKALLERGAIERVVIVGGRGEEGQVASLTEWGGAQGGRVVNLIGHTSVARLMATVARCGLLIGSDSAAVHMAVGFGRPCVALYGPTDVAKVGPATGGVTPAAPVIVLQRVGAGEPLGHKTPEPGRTYMSRITTGDVVDAACCATR
ncbi:MAG TPA: glycosyltransferase family 9 protein [Phycisphaerales bacterium]|nr:glycosyltransferase family 9 protein [Phycisphaerales bacterium]